MNALTVPARAVERLRRASEVPFSLCPVPEALVDGSLVTLSSARGEGVGLAVIDRTAACLRVMADAGESDSLDGQWAARRLEHALALRRRHGLAGALDAYRLLNGAGDRTPGVLADVYAGWAVVSALTPAMVPVATTCAETLVAAGHVRGVVVKRRGRGQASSGPATEAVVGETPPARVVVTEGPWRFEVHLATGVNVGLFTDMRAERAQVARLTRDRRVLNLFAYTGTLSVAAASGGATEVTSVDLSEGVLAWTRDHLVMNGLDVSHHPTVASDAATFLADARARGTRYDVVLIDPPSYSAARQAPFAIDTDYPRLIAAAVDVLAPGGDLWLASNTRGYSLIGAVQMALPPARHPRVVAEGGLPADYPTEPGDSEARYLQTVWLRLV